MNKRKLKLFLKIFFLLLIVQAIVVGSYILLSNADSSLASIASFIISIFSFPINIISPDLPFYSGEGTSVIFLFWTLNLVLQTMPIYAIIRMVQRLK
jgi:hypothetical protein